MLSSSISSRLRQLQRQHVPVDDPPPLPALSTQECASVGYSRQAPQAAFPARKGLAADLINKFNQLSSPPVPATVGRTPPSRGSIRPMFSRPELVNADRSSGPSQLPALARTKDPADRQTECLPQRSSQFLTDAELDRALFEILEFSRDMDICLFDDDNDGSSAGVAHRV
ncbi:hypothetical protein GGI23_007397 [Coemansia sp. RSA 2559]|nr:hypothetical protein GGI23_007397 [Coemansia sp. RSA 2559]KAJ2847005.1 hypothetical protein GGI22_006095 [Coemansia erecta]